MSVYMKFTYHYTSYRHQLQMKTCQIRSIFLTNKLYRIVFLMFLVNENCILRQIYVIYPIPLYIYMLHNYVKMTQGTHTTELHQQLW